MPNLLTIAGSDPSGGAGIQADLKTFSALGGYGMSVITGLTAQNTKGVRGVHAVPAPFVREQLDAIFDDVRVDAVKIGMLATADIVDAVAAVLAERRPPYVVLDPVMVAKSGDRLLAADAVAHLRDVLLPHVDLITPNLPEAADLLGMDKAADEATDKPADEATYEAAVEATDEASMVTQLRALATLGPAVLLKGGHLGGAESPDLFLDARTAGGAEAPVRLTAARVTTTNDHGTGCTLSSAIAALRPQRDDWISAISDAKDYLTGALEAATRLDVGHGHGPVHHFHQWW